VTAPCTGGLATIENLARHFGSDLFVLHFTYGNDEKAVRCTADQMNSMARFVSAHAGVEIARAYRDEFARRLR